MRLFAALTPDAVILDHLEAAVCAVVGHGLRADAEGRPGLVRGVPRENWHVTLAFFGEVGEGGAHDVGVAMQAAAATCAPLELELNGAGVYGKRTLWIGVGGDTAGLARLAGLCMEAGEQVGAAPDKHERSRGHLTIARSRRPSRELDPLARVLAVYRGPRWWARQVSLMQSHLGEGPGGQPRYETVASYRLGS